MNASLHSIKYLIVDSLRFSSHGVLNDYDDKSQCFFVLLISKHLSLNLQRQYIFQSSH